jgi:multiple sugar transport system permease protein
VAGFKTRTLPIAVYNFLSYEEINWGGPHRGGDRDDTLPVLALALLVHEAHRPRPDVWAQ